MSEDDKAGDKFDSKELALLRAGDSEAWGRVYGLMKPPVIAFISPKLKGVRYMDAEDIYQNVFLKIMKSFRNGRSHYEGWGPLLSYLLTIARNDLTQSYRNREVPLDTDREDDGSTRSVEELRDPRPGPDELYEGNEFEEYIESMMRGVSATQRNFIRLKFIEERENSEIAEILGITMNNVRVRVFRARKRLQKILLNFIHGRGRAF